MDQNHNERRLVEQCLPGHMLALLLESLCAKTNQVVRADVQHGVNVAAITPLAKLDDFSRARLARRVDRDARDILRDANIDDLREGTLAVCRFILWLVEEKRFLDAKNTAVLAALLIMTEAREDVEAGWRWTEGKGKDKSEKIWRSALFRGFYA